MRCSSIKKSPSRSTLSERPIVVSLYLVFRHDVLDNPHVLLRTARGKIAHCHKAVFIDIRALLTVFARISCPRADGFKRLGLPVNSAAKSFGRA